ncbi:Polyadenylate-binding protein 2 [Linum perenne]
MYGAKHDGRISRWQNRKGIGDFSGRKWRRTWGVGGSLSSEGKKERVNVAETSEPAAPSGDSKGNKKNEYWGIPEEIAQVQRVNIEGASSNNDPQLALASLYVGDLDFIGDETQLFGLFSKAQQKERGSPNVKFKNVFVKNLVDTILNDDFKRVFGEFRLITSDVSMRDICGRSNGFGFVNFVNKDDAARAIDALNRRKTHAAKELELLNFTPINGRPIRVMYSNNDPNVRKSGVENIFMKNFDKGLDHKALVDTFSIFGSILSCKLATHPYGHSKGYGFVQFDTEEAAKNAIKKLNEMMMNGKQLHVAHFIRKKERGSPNVNFKNVFVKNLVDTISNDDFKRVFGEFGPITSDVIMRDICGRSNGFGFVNFVNKDDAVRAIDTLNRRKIHGKAWHVGRAQKKNEREFELRQEAIEKFQDSNLYVKNIDDSLGEDELKQFFPPIGIVQSCKVMRYPNGISKRLGFVAFATPKEANKAKRQTISSIL